MMKGSGVLLRIVKNSNRQSMDGVLYCSESCSIFCLISPFIVKLCVGNDKKMHIHYFSANRILLFLWNQILEENEDD